MKKTYNINLNSQVFCIDEDAYTQLHNYIKTLEKHYLAEEDGKEIMADIESRIAELFTEFRQKSHKEVISQDDINKVIEIMGTPDIIIEEDNEHINRGTTPDKKLYRDPEHSVIGGVAAGLAAYSSISVIWIRLAFLLFAFFYGTTIIAYIILWIVIPSAKTAKQKLEMKGEQINVSTIEKNIRDTYNNVKKNSDFQRYIHQIGHLCSQLIKAISTIFTKILKIVLTLFAIGSLIGTAFIFILVIWLLLSSSSPLWTNHYCSICYLMPTMTLSFAKLVLLLIINIPLFLICYLAAYYLFKFRLNKMLILLISGCWFLAGLTGTCMAVKQGMDFSTQGEKETTQILTLPDASRHKYILNLQSVPASQRLIDYRYSDRNFGNFLGLDSITPQKIYIKTKINIDKSPNQQPQLSIKKYSRGLTPLKAQESINHIQYTWQQNEDQINLANYFTINRNHWKAQEVRVTLSIPDGDTLVIHSPKNEYENLVFHKYSSNITVGDYIVIMQNGKLKPLNTIEN